jgi:hypothetical protein
VTDVRPRIAFPCTSAGCPSFFALGDSTVTCRSLQTGLACWEQPVDFRPSWVACQGNLVVVAGSDGVEGHRAEDGSLMWSWQPVRDPASPATDDPRPGLSDFRLVDSRLYFLQQERQLLALDVDSGRVLWNLWAPAGRLYLPNRGGLFFHHYQAAAQNVLLHTTAGKCLVVDAQTGRIRHQIETTKSAWLMPPLAVSESRVVIVPDAGRVLALDLPTGTQAWTFELEPSVSLTGEAPELLASRDRLLLLVRRNYGTFMECLDLATGSRHWPQPLFLGTRTVELETGIIDGSSACVMVDGMIRSYALADGKLIWRHPLPDFCPGWRITRTQQQILLVPLARQSYRLSLRWLWGALEFTRTTAQGQYLGVQILDTQSGTLVQSLNFPASSPRASLRGSSAKTCAVFPQLRSVTLAAEDDPGLVVHVSERRLNVALDGEVWGLTTK